MKIKYVVRAILLSSIVFISACKEGLYSDLSERDANEMMAVLLPNGIGAEKKRVKKTYSLMVDKAYIASAVQLLSAHGLPRDTYQEMGQIFEKKGLVSSPMEERVRYIYGLSQQVSETISQIDGVITSRVNVVLPDNNIYSDVITPSAASVFVKYRADSKLGEHQAKIKRIVENSIEGLTYDNISLVMLPAKEIQVLVQKNQTTDRMYLWVGIIFLVLLIMVFFLYPTERKALFDKIKTMLDKKNVPAEVKSAGSEA